MDGTPFELIEAPKQFDLTEQQKAARKLLSGGERHNLLYGGARSGKTFILCYAIVVRALKAPGSRHAILRFRFNHCTRSIGRDTMPKVLKLAFPSVKPKLDKSEWFWTFPNGSEIWLGGLDDSERVEKILGQEYATIYLNECSQISFTASTTARTRAAQRVEQVINGKSVGLLPVKYYYDCNPSGTGHWTYKQFVEKTDPASRAPLRNPDNYTTMVLNPQGNADHLAPEILEELRNLPEKQRIRFWEGKFQAELDNALWTHESFVKMSPPSLADFQRIVVAVDPSGASGEEDKRSDEIGIVVCGQTDEDRYWVLEDLSFRAGPRQWARRAIGAYHKWDADCIVGEINFGGAMVERVISAEDESIPFKEVHASRGKHVRAEPISTLYAKKQVIHSDEVDLGALEDQMVNMTTAGYMGHKSPDRLDACVWAMTELSAGAVVQHFGTA